MKWNTKDEPPKDTAFIADVGLPFSVVAMWNEPSQNYVYANLQVDLYEGKWNDTYFENETEEEIKAWMRMPEVAQ